MNFSAKWVRPTRELGEVAPRFFGSFALSQPVRKAVLYVTANGTFVPELNGKRVGSDVLAPGWTDYRHRLQYKSYDITALLAAHNTLTVTVGRGWYRSRMWNPHPITDPAALLAEIEIQLENGGSLHIGTDESWRVSESLVRFSDIYDGEIQNAAAADGTPFAVEVFDGLGNTLIPQEGEDITEAVTVYPKKIFTTPNGETVVDFGQNLTGYVRVCVCAHTGQKIQLSHGEVLDRDGNFYTENYRSAKALFEVTCTEGENCAQPLLTFYGFRYIRVDAFPGEARLEHFRAIAVCSELKQTMEFSSSDRELNQLVSNILWGQRGNFLDVPTDCPQRDERMGWTGDAQVFAKTACYNFDVRRFFTKWLRDMQLGQEKDGRIPKVVPAVAAPSPLAGWGDAGTIIPWTLYEMYGDAALLQEFYPMMCKWVDYITGATTTPYLWTGGKQLGDWLALDAPSGSYKGASRDDLVASAFYACSTALVIKAGKALGEDVTRYETLYDGIVKAFQDTYPEYQTQTECVLALQFGLAADRKKTAAQLADMVKRTGHLETGFLGTPYLLHALSDNGYPEIAYELLLRRSYPSWLYSVSRGATTIWEHWDGVMENGDFWSKDMNSFNHYAFGAVGEWIYGKAAGITPLEPGFRKVRIAPNPDARLDWLKVSYDSVQGKIVSGWRKFEGMWRFEIETPVPAEIVIGENTCEVSPGSYVFYAEIK